MESDLTASDAAYFMRLLHDALVAGKLEYVSPHLLLRIISPIALCCAVVYNGVSELC